MAASRRYLRKQLMSTITVVLPRSGEKSVPVKCACWRTWSGRAGPTGAPLAEHGRRDLVQFSKFVSSPGGPLLILTRWRRIRLISSGSSMTAMTAVRLCRTAHLRAALRTYQRIDRAVRRCDAQLS